MEATRGVTGLVYRSIRGTTRGMAMAYDAAIRQFDNGAVTESLTPGVVAARAALNGIVGDHLVATHNPLATTMSVRRDGRALDLVPGALAKALSDARRHVVVLVHGLCMADVWLGPTWTRSRRGAGSRSRLHGDVPSLQQRAPYLDERTRAGGHPRHASTRLAGVP